MFWQIYCHVMTYGDSKVLNKRIASDKLLCDKAFNVDQNPRYQYQWWISMWTCFDDL